MSVAVSVLKAQDEPVGGFENVIGYVIACVVRQPDGEISLEREIAVHADSGDDNALAESVVKTIEAKLNEAFPDPNQPEPSKIWVPA